MIKIRSREARLASISGRRPTKNANVFREYAIALIQAGLLAAFIIVFIAQSHFVSGTSMLNTLHHGERIMVEKITYRFSQPKRGEIIVLRNPADPAERFVKRVIGIPGDIVEIRNRQVYLNGAVLDEPYINQPPYQDMLPVEVQPEHVFVMGDNRNASLDSRTPSVGQIPYDMIIGKAAFTYWPVKRIKLHRNPQSDASPSN